MANVCLIDKVLKKKRAFNLYSVFSGVLVPLQLCFSLMCFSLFVDPDLFVLAQSFALMKAAKHVWNPSG